MFVPSLIQLLDILFCSYYYCNPPPSGVVPALFQGPLSRFGDTAANTGILTLMNSLDSTKDLAVGFKTVAASASAALFRIVIMPIDTTKTVRTL